MKDENERKGEKNESRKLKKRMKDRKVKGKKEESSRVRSHPTVKKVKTNGDRTFYSGGLEIGPKMEKHLYDPIACYSLTTFPFV